MQSVLKTTALILLLTTLASGYSHNYIAKIQKELIELGYDPGPVDGLMGPQTRSAIKAFQRSIGKRPTGRVTKTLQWQLKNMLNSAAAGFSQEAEERNGIKQPD